MKKPLSPIAKAERAALRAVQLAEQKAATAALKRMNKKPRCVECESWNVQMTTGTEVYPHRPDLADLQYWLCECGAYIGCRKGTDYTPNGRPAHAATRRAREAAMAVFEPIWKAAAARDEIHPLHARQRGYRWLALQLGVEESEGDITMMNADLAQRAVEICLPLVKPRA